MPLADVLNDPNKKPAVIADCMTLLDQEVSDKGGFSGLAIKAGYAAVKGIKPGFIRSAIEGLLPEFAKALEGVYAEAKEKGPSISSYFVTNATRVADALLGITDAKAQRASGLVKSTYEKLRPKGKENVVAAAPRLGRLIEKHAP